MTTWWGQLTVHDPDDEAETQPAPPERESRLIIEDGWMRDATR